MRTLEFHKVAYGIVANGKQDPIFLTKYKKSVLVTRENQDLLLGSIKRILMEVKRKMGAGDFLIAPSTEALNRFLLENRVELEKEGFGVPLVTRECYETVSNKYSFGKLCEQSDIRTPSHSLDCAKMQPPFVAKPKKYISKNKTSLSPVLIFSDQDKRKFIKENDVSDFYFQEFIGGRSFYLLYYFSRKGEVYKFSQENYIQQPHGKSVLGAVSADIHKKDISGKFEKLFRTLNFFGLVMIEIKVSENKEYMIEANPRFWGPSQLFVDAGANLFEAFLYDWGLIDKKPSFGTAGDEKYFWLGGLINSLVDGGEVVFHGRPKDDFVREIDDWVRVDLYNRPDTRNIFKKELNL